ncbi:MAG TPA: hypothetical protein VFN13_12550 [Rudaea sp.]|nr:hypothetical protein [Rudaea sp.]
MKISTLCKRPSIATTVALLLALFFAPVAQAKLKTQNLVQLIASSQSIVAGTVSKVTDGIDANGLPYTEVTIQVGASAKGNIRHGAYTFRQFGLLKPRTMANGHRMLGVTPPEFPRWHADEYVVVFLYHPAAKTGLQTTTGLVQGKFLRINKKLTNGFDNAGLFENIKTMPGVLSSAETKLLHSSRGPVSATTLMGLIERVVKGNWIEKGMIK